MSGSVELSDFSDNRLNRYSFVWNGEFAEFPAHLDQLISDPDGLFGTSVHLVTCFWLSGEEAFRSKLQMKVRQKSGWTIIHDEDIGIAVKESFLPLLDLSTEDVIALTEGSIFVYRGSANALNREFVLLFPTLLKFFARFGRIAPNQSMLNWLWDNDGEMGYCKRSDRDRQGIVFITPNKLDLGKLVRKGLVEQVYRPPEAADVWVLP
jgi:hypothetical protein